MPILQILKLSYINIKIKHYQFKNNINIILINMIYTYIYLPN